MFNRSRIEAKAKACADAGAAYKRECAAEPNAVAARWLEAEKRRILNALAFLFEKPKSCVAFHPAKGRVLADCEVPVYPIYIKLLHDELVASGFVVELGVSGCAKKGFENCLEVFKTRNDREMMTSSPNNGVLSIDAALTFDSRPLHFDFSAFVAAQLDDDDGGTTATRKFD